MLRKTSLGMLLAVAVFSCSGKERRLAEQDAASLDGQTLRSSDFTPEIQKASELHVQELITAQEWAHENRNRDLLDVLSATVTDETDPDVEFLIHPHCRGRFKGDGWTTLCNKLARQIERVSGLSLNNFGPIPPKPASKPRSRVDAPTLPSLPDRFLEYAIT